MIEPPLPLNELERLKALQRYDVLYTPPESAFDDLTWLAAEVLNVPIALVSLIDGQCQWFKSRCGLDAESTPRSISFCGHAILKNEPLLVENALEDERFADNPLVTGPPDIRFYLGIPLTTPDGFNLGTLCVIDRKPHSPDPKKVKMLQALANQVISQMELRLSGRALGSALQKADEASKAKSEFLANMSHEIRTPMNGIIGMTSLMLNNASDPVQKENLEVINESADILLRQINGLLDLSKIEADKLELEQYTFDLHARINSMLKPFQVIAKKKHVTMKFTWDEQIPKLLLGDYVRIQQVLSNLLGNALKFTSQGSISLTVSKTGFFEGKHLLQFEVRDTGCGIPAEKQLTIFEPFAQADVSVNRKYGGTGLGLTISMKLVRLMGGCLELESEEGKGSCFRFMISLAEGTQKEEPVDEIDDSSLPRYRVLVAEDNIINQRVIGKMLDRLEQTYVIASTGLEAVERVSNDSFDLIFMDIQMPEMDGIEAMKHIRENIKEPPPIIALTAQAMKGNREALIEMGMDDFLSKPIKLKSLRQILSRYGKKGKP